jgi:hypothetical protein
VIPKEFYRPNPNPNRQVEDRNKLFATLNAYITKRNGWMVSVPGDSEMRFQALPDSTLPGAHRELGYIVEPIGETQRILPHAIVEKLVTTSSGALVRATESSTPTIQITHAGLATVIQCDLRAPEAR